EDRQRLLGRPRGVQEGPAADQRLDDRDPLRRRPRRQLPPRRGEDGERLLIAQEPGPHQRQEIGPRSRRAGQERRDRFPHPGPPPPARGSAPARRGPRRGPPPRPRGGSAPPPRRWRRGP